MELETERLHLKKYHSSDVDNYLKLKSNPIIWKYSSQEPMKDRNEMTLHLNELIDTMTDYQFHALYIKNGMEYIGEAGILSYNERNHRAVIGYNLLPDFWSKGYASEITKALVNDLFESNDVERIEALVVFENIASKKVLEKSGFKLEGILRHFTWLNGKYRDVCFYGLIRSDWNKNQS